MPTIVLSAVISPDLTLEVNASALDQAPGGVALRFGLLDGPICFTLTADEAQWLTQQIDQHLAAAELETGHRRRAGSR